MPTNNYRERLDSARAVGGAPAAGGEAARQVVERMGGHLSSALGAVKRNTIDPAANALKTVVTGDPTPIPGTRGTPNTPTTQNTPAAPDAPYRTPSRTNAFGAADAASTAGFNSNPAYAQPDAMSRMTGMGYSNRGVQGAEGVTRFDKAGQSPLYTNVPGNTADWVGGGMKPGVNTIPSAAFTGAGRGNASAIQRGNTAMRDEQSFNAGNTLSRGSGGIRIGGGGEGGGGVMDFVRNWNADRASQQRRLPSGHVLAKDTQLNGALTAFMSGQNTGADNAAAMGRAELGEQGATRRAQMGNANQIQNTMLQGQNQRDNTNLSGQWDMSRQGLADAGAYQRAELGADQRTMSAEISQLARVAYSADETVPERTRINAQNRLFELQGGVQERADGGMVYGPEDFDSAVGYAQGGMVGGAGYGQTPQAPQVLPEINEYRDYAMGAKQLGLPAIPFEQFLTLRAGAKQVGQAPQAQQTSAMGFAQGGEIPDPRDVSGRMVMDADPNAPTDSIPALVDEQMPAKLDSGEFVVPADVVKFFGTDKLNKMIAAARQGAQG